MRRKRREPPQQLRQLQLQQPQIYFNNQSESVGRCSICNKGENALMSPCECHTRYHQRCLLLYIRGVIRRSLRERQEMDLSSIRCRRCEGQFHVHFTSRNEYNCQVFTQRISRNCCNKHVIAITVLIIIIIVTIVVYINQFTGSNPSPNKKLMYGIIALAVIEGLIFIVVFMHFIQSYLLLKQIVLERVYEVIDLRSMASSSSDDNKISDDCEVVVR